jgi:hypothetical protein
MQHEIDADRIAASFFTRVIDAGAPELASAPVLLMRCFDLLERSHCM